MPQTPSTQAHLRFVQLNLENLFIFLDHYKGEDLKTMSEREWQKMSNATVHNKPLHKLFALRDAINDLDPDFVLLNEVGGQESLKHFNKLFLESKFNDFLIEGNSDRGIDVGYLVHKRVPLKPLLLTHKNRPLQFLYPHEQNIPDYSIKSHFFSRDVSELRLFKDGQTKPSLVMLLTHLKSKLDHDGIDYQGRLRRGAEAKILAQIYQEVKKELEEKIPIIVAGDFNGVAHKASCEPEFEVLHKETDLVEALSLSQITIDQRVTQVQFPKDGQRHGIQLDYIFISPNLRDELLPDQTFIYRYKSDLKVELPLPLTYDQADHLPSDHYPVVATFKNFLF